MEKVYSIEQIKTMTFESTDIQEPSDAPGERASYRLSASQIKGIPTERKDINTLRRRLAELFQEKLKGSYALLKTECDIKDSIFRKMLQFQGGRNVTYLQLSKFCIGAKLSEETVRELFILFGHELSDHNLPDYILLCAVKNGDNIVEYNKYMQTYCNRTVLTDDNK